MTALFLQGHLLSPALRLAVLGRPTDMQAARLEGFAQGALPGARWPVLVPRAEARVDGAILTGLSTEDLLRLDHHEAVLGQTRVALDLGGRPGFAYVAVDPAAAQPWTAELALPDGAAILATAAEDVMALMGRVPPEAMARRHDAMLVRAASRLRARRDPGPTGVRHRAVPGDVVVEAWRQPYANFFSVEETDLSFRRFDGSLSPTVTRAAFVSGDAVIVLPYDPRRDRVMLVEQFRAGPFGRGDPQPWQLEAVAGRIDPGETPEQAARREAVEEAGLVLGDLLPVSACYASPGAKSEFLYCYVGLCDLPDGAAGLFGLAEEAEDIRGHLVGFDALMELMASGEIATAPVVLSVFWLALHRDRLRAAAV
jgi:ADP-ribose pyrophosphatase